MVGEWISDFVQHILMICCQITLHYKNAEQQNQVYRQNKQKFGSLVLYTLVCCGCKLRSKPIQCPNISLQKVLTEVWGYKGSYLGRVKYKLRSGTSRGPDLGQPNVQTGVQASVVFKMSYLSLHFRKTQFQPLAFFLNYFIQFSYLNLIGQLVKLLNQITNKVRNLLTL